MRSVASLRMLLLGAIVAAFLVACRDARTGEQHELAPPGAKAGLGDEKNTCVNLGRDQALVLLSTLSGSASDQRLALTVHDARAVLEEEASFVSEGWPSVFMQGWMRDAWTDITFQQVESGTIVALKHGNPLDSQITRFEVVCDHGWVVERIGPVDRWYAPAPQNISGQDGELTEVVAMDIVRDVLLHYGTTRMRVTATGPELERGRLLAIVVASGAPVAPQAWGGLGKHITLHPDGPDRVIGNWTKNGMATGEKLLFQRTGGLWKLADHTEEGNWAPAKRPGFALPRDLSADEFLLGIEPGMDISKVVQLAGKPDEIRNRTYMYQARQLSVTFDDYAKVSRVEARSGATWRGLRVGDPRDRASLLYGQPGETTPQSLIYVVGPRRLIVGVGQGSDGVERVISLVFETTLSQKP